MRLEQRPASGRPIVYERPSPTAPQPPLADYADTYRSAELSSRWIVRANGDRLQVIMPRDTAELRRAGPDMFSDGYLLVVFTRDRAGRVTGLAASTLRTLGSRFIREG